MIHRSRGQHWTGDDPDAVLCDQENNADDPIASHTGTTPKERNTNDSQILSNATDEANENEKFNYPEGGTQAWLVVLGAWCAMIPSMGLLNTLAILEAWVASEELPTMDTSTIGWIFSCYAFLLYFCGAQVGMLSC